jgi:hypothetical protein
MDGWLLDNRVAREMGKRVSSLENQVHSFTRSLSQEAEA